MKNNRMDEWMEVPVALVSTLLMLLVSWFVFDLFGFSCDQTWQFILFMIGFLALDLLFGELSDRLELWLVKNRWKRGFWEVTLSHAMIDFLSALGMLLILRHLPGIHIKAVGAYRFAFVWGLTSVAVCCWDEWGPRDED